MLNAELDMLIACVAGGVNGGVGEFGVLAARGARPGSVVIGVPKIVLVPRAALFTMRLFAVTSMKVLAALAAPVFTTVGGRSWTTSVTVRFWKPSL